MKYYRYASIVLVTLAYIPALSAQTKWEANQQEITAIDLDQNLQTAMRSSFWAEIGQSGVSTEITEMDTCACNGARRTQVKVDCGGGRTVFAPCYTKYILGTTNECGTFCQPTYNACKGDPDPGCQ